MNADLARWIKYYWCLNQPEAAYYECRMSRRIAGGHTGPNQYPKPTVDQPHGASMWEPSAAN
jgi:hypothetical protein